MENPPVTIIISLVSNSSHVKTLMLFVTLFHIPVCGCKIIIVNVDERPYPIPRAHVQ